MTDEVILIVEDNNTLRDGLKMLLEMEGYKAYTACHGIDALGWMESISPNLIVSDISMPKMDGFQFYKEVRARPEWIAIPFIFLTARGERADVFAGRKLGVEDYIIKPVKQRELIAAIRSRLDRSQQLMLAQLKRAYESSLILLANAIELRDDYTGGHVERVTQFCLMIAEQLSLTPAQIKSLKFGAILHDIGKIQVSEEILSKAGPLSTPEWNEMQKHTADGAELLETVPYLHEAIPIIRYHHERWDGKGYPDGLSGEEIPLGARIVAVADSYDAMTTNRVYQDSITHEQALQEIRKESGTKYDPQVVEALNRAWETLSP
jgi:putative two-component system response regulator